MINQLGNVYMYMIVALLKPSIHCNIEVITVNWSTTESTDLFVCNPTGVSEKSKEEFFYCSLQLTKHH